ncbi:hypothetical protein Q4491_09515 [Photobacterium sp. 2_MG-2023]|uniref:hypothetical protein n=1 Tax=Photobacterium sp. 2_MG-2023 TaxID=3062663 RepID=UPI0026E1CF28|nr:hypothetical protein [Photobacterium sp. 2_MG-2023]MDO6581582.1 hypothetical protein [Photobacterium sp. 2_MG-2023]
MRYELIESHRLSLSDLHRVLSPDIAMWHIRGEFGINVKGVDGLPLQDGQSRDDILRKIQSGDLLVLGDRGDLYDASGNLKSHLPFGFSSRIRSLQRTARPTRHVKANYAPFDPDTNMYEAVSEVASRAVGAGKQFVNDFVRHQAAQLGEHLADEGVIVATSTETGKILSPEELSQAYIDNGQEMYAIEGELELQGAETLKRYESYQAMVPIVSAAAGGYKGIFKLAKDPQILSDLLEAALRDARSIPEALGQLGMEHAKHRLEIATHPDFVNRYHGPDCIGLDKNCALVEIESKGTTGSSRTVSLNTQGMKQGSADKNMYRGQQMRQKRHKIGLDSNRQGGPYREDEIGLWRDIYSLNGEKRHILVNTDVSTGKVRVYEQDVDGNILHTLDEFVIEGFAEAKSVISKLF